MEYQSAMQIVLQVLLGWDCKTKRGVKGILGIVEAFGKCDEEQGRKTLHTSHCGRPVLKGLEN